MCVHWDRLFRQGQLLFHWKLCLAALLPIAVQVSNLTEGQAQLAIIVSQSTAQAPDGAHRFPCTWTVGSFSGLQIVFITNHRLL
jgi:hypothetical protein